MSGLTMIRLDVYGVMSKAPVGHIYVSVDAIVAIEDLDDYREVTLSTGAKVTVCEDVATIVEHLADGKVEID